MDLRKVYTLKKGYPIDVKDQINIYTIDKEYKGTKLIGSFSYKSSNASDIDLLEEIKRNSPRELIYLVCNNLKKVVNNIVLRPDQIFAEVKCGLDHLYYDVDFGKCSHNVYNIPPAYYDIMLMYYKRHFISTDEMNTISNVFKSPKKGQYEYEVIQNLMRSHFIVRWTANEIMRGYKILVTIDNVAYKYTLNMALTEKSSINIEGIFISSDNKYVECSNFMWLCYIGKDGSTLMLNMPDLYLQNIDKYFGEDLKKSMYTLLYSKYLSYNPFKAVKRMFSYARFYKSSYLLESSYKLINSHIGNLYNLNTQLKTISKVLKIHGHKGLYLNTIYHQLDYVRWNIQAVILKDFNVSDIVHYLGDIIGNKKTLSQSDVIAHLDIITKKISGFINDITIRELKNLNLYPLPDNLIPVDKPF